MGKQGRVIFITTGAELLETDRTLSVKKYIKNVCVGPNSDTNMAAC